MRVVAKRMHINFFQGDHTLSRKNCLQALYAPILTKSGRGRQVHVRMWAGKLQMHGFPTLTYYGNTLKCHNFNSKA